MASLTVLQFPNADGAGIALDKVKSLHKLRLIQLIDAAIVAWPEGKKSPKTKQLVSLTGAGAFQGAFWGMLFGLIFFVPYFGLAVGAAMGGLSGVYADFGINDNFIKQIQAKITVGTSALFLMTRDAVLEKVADEFKDQDFEIIATNLSIEQEKALKAAFSLEEE